MNRRWVVVAGGELTAGDLLEIRPGDRVVAVDGGVRSLLQTRVPFHSVVGDFDTLGFEVPETLKRKGIRVEHLPEEKDMTDTQYAVETAMAEGAEEICILGALGGPRVDHALANLFLLEKMEGAGVRGVIRNSHNRIRLHTGERREMILERDSFRYVSLLALTDQVTGIFLEGFRYPLRDAVLLRSYPMGISNEISGERARIQIATGKLLVVESRD